MEATSLRPTHDGLVDYETNGGPAGRCRLRAFADVRVAVISELPENPGPSIADAMPAPAMAVERFLDVRFFGTSWRLVEHVESELTLVTFGGYDKRGRLERPDWQPAPEAMGWVREALARES